MWKKRTEARIAWRLAHAKQQDSVDLSTKCARMPTCRSTKRMPGRAQDAAQPLAGNPPPLPYTPPTPPPPSRTRLRENRTARACSARSGFRSFAHSRTAGFFVWEACGLASVYSSLSEETASGEDTSAKTLTAAHRSLPFQTMLLVENKDNGRRQSSESPIAALSSAEEYRRIAGCSTCARLADLTKVMPEDPVNSEHRPTDEH